MQEQLVSFETSVLARSKGFVKTGNWMGFVDKFYHPRTGTLLSMGRTGRTPFNTLIYAPPQSLLQRWLREVHNINIQISVMVNSMYNGYNFEIRLDRKYITSHYCSKTYEDSLELALQEALKLIK